MFSMSVVHQMIHEIGLYGSSQPCVRMPQGLENKIEDVNQENDKKSKKNYHSLKVKYVTRVSYKNPQFCEKTVGHLWKE